jgi:hypothetical protein
MAGPVPRQYRSQYIFQGPADVYLNVVRPPSSAAPTADANTVLLENGIPIAATNAKFLGSTEGPATVGITEEVNPIRDDQHESAIDAGFTVTSAEIGFTVKETRFQTLDWLITGPDLFQYIPVTGGEYLSGGGQLNATAQTMSILLIAPRLSTPSKYAYVLGYKCYLKSALESEFSRSKESVWKVTFGLIMDMTRVQGDELMQWLMQV